jgi:hypothetical protein
MKFGIRYSNTFIMNLCMIALAVLMTIYSWAVTTHGVTGIVGYIPFVWLFLGFTRFAIYRKYLWLSITGKAALILTDEFISDEANGLKYFWKDITGLREENAYLYLSLKDPYAYLSQIKNPLKRVIIRMMGAAVRINVDVVNVDVSVLIELIENHLHNDVNINN